jgi:ATP-dependent DNA ligase
MARRDASQTYAPMKAVLVGKPVSGPGWLFERKLDGIRCGVIRRGRSARLMSPSVLPERKSLADFLERTGGA